MLGPIIVAIPKCTKGKLALAPKQKDGTSLASKVHALEMPPENIGYPLPPPGTTDASSVGRGVGKNAGREIKEWQAMMGQLSKLPVKTRDELPVIPVDERAAARAVVRVASRLFTADDGRWLVKRLNRGWKERSRWTHSG